MMKFGLIGKSLVHSFSQAFFTQFFREKNISASYENIEINTIEAFPDLLSKNFTGFNVTVPYKEQIIPFLDDLSLEAELIKAVNVVSRVDDKWIGHNTDAYGFQQSIKPFLTNKHERAIIFGTGGASKAVEFTLKTLGIEVIFITRNPRKENHFSYEEVNHIMLNSCKLLVNCTPLGTFPKIDECIPIPTDLINESHLVYDMVYNPEKSKLLQLSEKNGAQIINGESMLKHQALKSWEIWNSI